MLIHAGLGLILMKVKLLTLRLLPEIFAPCRTFH